MTDPAPDWGLAERRGYDRAIQDIAAWLETCVRGVSLYHRVDLAADLRDGTWRTAAPLKGLRPDDLLLRRAQTLHRRGVTVDDMPDDVREFVHRRRAANAAARDEHTEEVARILRDVYNLDAPGTAP